MVKSGQVLVVVFTTADPTTKVPTNATGTPSVVLYISGVLDAAVVTVANLATGRYKATVTLPAFDAGDTVTLLAAATVSGQLGERVIFQSVGDKSFVSDVIVAVRNMLRCF